MSALFPDDPCVHCLLCCILDDQDQVQLRRLTLEEFRRYSEQFLAFNQVSTRNMPFFVGPNVMLQVNEKDVTKNGIMSKCLVPVWVVGKKDQVLEKKDSKKTKKLPKKRL